MKNYILLLVLSFLSYNGFSQDYLEKIAKESCSCLKKLDKDIDVEQAQVKLGLCMIDESMPYKDELKKDHGVDLDNINEGEGEKLGRIVGFKMASICPNEIMKLVSTEDESTGSSNDSDERIDGKITDIKSDKFIEFSVKSNEGKTLKMYWLTYVKSNVELTNDYKSLKGKKVSVSYSQMEFFDARIAEYRIFNVVSEIEVVD